MKILKSTAVILLLGAAFILLLNSSFGTNIWFLLTEPAYVIPSESSLFTFKVTTMNPGSGDWWVYGEDGKNYYYFTGNDNSPYILISKKKSNTCEGFDANDYKTWCSRRD